MSLEEMNRYTALQSDTTLEIDAASDEQDVSKTSILESESNFDKSHDFLASLSSNQDIIVVFGS